MKSKLYILLFVIFCFALPVAAQEIKQTKPVVMILGSYHMGNPGLDLNNVKADDVRAPKRQREMTEFIALIKKFKPTKIAVEVPTDKAQYLESYAQYLGGKYELKANEIDQIGFRLAKELNHKQIYPIDWKGNFDFDRVLASAKTNKQETITDATTAWGKTITAEANERMKTATITELLREMNDEKNVARFHQPYMTFVRVGAGTDFAGADLVRDWYERNLKIYANITRLADSPNERILVIIGAGHLRTLQHFISESSEYELEQAGKYLK
jgi:hypothetical protein